MARDFLVAFVSALVLACLGCDDGTCFAAGTRIGTPSGEVPIEELRVGDVVWSYDVARGRRVPAPVVRTFVHEGATVRDLHLDNGRAVRVTDAHPVFLPDEGRYVPASHLKPGARLLTLVPHADAGTSVNEVGGSDSGVTVYNLEVAGHHNYFAEGFLVHNKSFSFVEYVIHLELDWRSRELQLSPDVQSVECWLEGRSWHGGGELLEKEMLLSLLEDKARIGVYETDSEADELVPPVEVCLPSRPCFERLVRVSGPRGSWSFALQDHVVLAPETLELIDALVAVHTSCIPEGEYQPIEGYGPHPNCDVNDDCADDEVCDTFGSPPLCASRRCVSDNKRCPTGYSCRDTDDDCDPKDDACPGDCICEDACFPERCEEDSDCEFGRYCRGLWTQQCVQFDCGGGSVVSSACLCPPGEDCFNPFLGGPPVGSECVDDPGTECDMATNRSCTGLCVVDAP